MHPAIGPGPLDPVRKTRPLGPGFLWLQTSSSCVLAKWHQAEVLVMFTAFKGADTVPLVFDQR